MPLKACTQSGHSKKLSLIAGMGKLPEAVASEAKKKGFKVIAITLSPIENKSLKHLADEFHKIHIGRLDELISLLKNLSITDAVMAGKVPKDLLYKYKGSIAPDLRALKLLCSLKNRSDDTIMKAIIRELEKENIKLHKTTAFTENLIAPKGVLSCRKPTKSEWKDIEFGWDIAKKMGGLDIGQTVVVKDAAVMAVEAIEGTDEAIKRGGSLAGEGAVVIKVSKPKQDMRFDVPVVGANTLHSMQNVKSKVLAVEAGKCIIIEREDFIKEADRAGIAVVGLD